MGTAQSKNERIEYFAGELHGGSTGMRTHLLPGRRITIVGDPGKVLQYHQSHSAPGYRPTKLYRPFALIGKAGVSVPHGICSMQSRSKWSTHGRPAKN